jgi:acyl carrier protein
MLELDMDMEADLGIDSIKRVEIMGALQEMYPDLPKPENLEELSELRTIGQIVQYLQKSTTENSTGNASVVSIGEAEIITETVETIETRPTVSVPEVIVNNSFTPIEESLQESPQESPQETLPANIEVTAIVDIDLSNLAQDILNITSEKTGYPVEMLELDMDMEADLGIDSIKRVEIMGALQEMHPALPKPDNLEELSELRTIGQIVEYLQKSGGTQKKNSSLKQTMSVSQ